MNCYRANQVRLDVVIDRIVHRLRAYPSALRQLGRDWLATLGPDPLRYHSAPDASPLLHLPIWLTEGRRGKSARIGARRLDGILEATALLYFHTRIQDNVLDEPQTRGQVPQLLLGNMFFLEAWQCLRAMSLSDRFWLRANQAWQIFSDATEAERRQVQGRAPYSAALFRRHARKVALARIPLYAVTDHDKGDDKNAIDTFIDRLGQAYGLVNDVLGVERDLRAGMRTYLISTVEESVLKRNRRDPAALRKGLLRHPYLENFLDQAVTLHRRIQPLGEALGISQMASYTKERIERIREHYDRAVDLRLCFALSGKAWPRGGVAAKHR